MKKRLILILLCTMMILPGIAQSFSLSAGGDDGGIVVTKDIFGTGIGVSSSGINFTYSDDGYYSRRYVKHHSHKKHKKHHKKHKKHGKKYYKKYCKKHHKGIRPAPHKGIRPAHHKGIRPAD